MSFHRPSNLTRNLDAQKARPKLWAEGSQRPRFNIAAFARVSLVMSRRAARPVLIWLAGLMAGAARRMANNSVGPRLARMGKLGRALPSRTSLATGLVGVASLLSAAADFAVPPPPVVVPPAFPDLMRPATARNRRSAVRLPDPAPLPEPLTEPAPAVPADAVPASEFDTEILAAIRAMINELREPPVVKPRRPDQLPPEPEPPLTGRDLLTGHIPLEPPIPPDPTLQQQLIAKVFLLGAGAVGCATVALTFPVGATKALLVHLNGDDLRHWS